MTYIWPLGLSPDVRRFTVRVYVSANSPTHPPAQHNVPRRYDTTSVAQKEGISWSVDGNIVETVVEAVFYGEPMGKTF